MQHSRRARLFTVLTVLVVACVPPTVEETADRVVRVEACPCGQTGAGIGTVVGPDLVLTNAHIVAGSLDDVRVRTPHAETLDAVVVGFDPARGLT